MERPQAPGCNARLSAPTARRPSPAAHTQRCATSRHLVVRAQTHEQALCSARLCARPHRGATSTAAALTAEQWVASLAGPASRWPRRCSLARSGGASGRRPAPGLWWPEWRSEWPPGGGPSRRLAPTSQPARRRLPACRLPACRRSRAAPAAGRPHPPAALRGMRRPSLQCQVSAPSTLRPGRVCAEAWRCRRRGREAIGSVHGYLHPDVNATRVLGGSGRPAPVSRQHAARLPRTACLRPAGRAPPQVPVHKVRPIRPRCPTAQVEGCTADLGMLRPYFQRQHICGEQQGRGAGRHAGGRPRRMQCCPLPPALPPCAPTAACRRRRRRPCQAQRTTRARMRSPTAAVASCASASSAPSWSR